MTLFAPVSHAVVGVVLPTATATTTTTTTTTTTAAADLARSRPLASSSRQPRRLSYKLCDRLDARRTFRRRGSTVRCPPSLAACQRTSVCESYAIPKPGRRFACVSQFTRKRRVCVSRPFPIVSRRYQSFTESSAQYISRSRPLTAVLSCADNCPLL